MTQLEEDLTRAKTEITFKERENTQLKKQLQESKVQMDTVKAQVSGLFVCVYMLYQALLIPLVCQRETFYLKCKDLQVTLLILSCVHL